MQKSEDITKLAQALVEAQKEISGAAKDKTNPHFKSKYADLSSVSDACKKPLNDHGIAFIQTAEPSDPGTLTLTTSLIHESGQWIAGTCTMPVQQATPQAYGSALTYARRYGLAAMVGVCPEDDDAESAEGRNGHRPPARQPAPARKPVDDKMDADEQWLISVDELLASKGFDDSQINRVKASVCRTKKITNILKLDTDARAGFITAVKEGKFDVIKGGQTAGAK